MFSRRTFCLEGCYTYTQLPTPKSLQHGVALPRHIYIYIFLFSFSTPNHPPQAQTNRSSPSRSKRPDSGRSGCFDRGSTRFQLVDQDQTVLAREGPNPGQPVGI
jgi:hypothetical protein